jgi:hypothetical protein
MMLCKVFNCFEAETYLASCDQSDLVIEIGDVLVGMETGAVARHGELPSLNLTLMI